MNTVFVLNDWNSGTLRRQIADKIGVRCIEFGRGGCIDSRETVVLTKVVPPNSLLKQNKNLFLDIVDWDCVDYLLKNPTIKIIAMSDIIKYELRSAGVKNDIFVIYEHHCNFDEFRRPIRPVRFVGYVGEPESLQLPVDKLTSSLSSVGLKFNALMSPKSRKDVVDFLMSIDINISFRPILPGYWRHGSLKILNAGSFGIPSVCFPEPSFVDEFNGLFLPVADMDSLVYQCQRLKNCNEFYNTLGNNLVLACSAYNIDNISSCWKRILSISESEKDDKAV